MVAEEQGRDDDNANGGVDCSVHRPRLRKLLMDEYDLVFETRCYGSHTCLNFVYPLKSVGLIKWFP